MNKKVASKTKETLRGDPTMKNSNSRRLPKKVLTFTPTGLIEIDNFLRYSFFVLSFGRFLYIISETSKERQKGFSILEYGKSLRSFAAYLFIVQTYIFRYLLNRRNSKGSSSS